MSSRRLDGKVAIVTASTEGIGYAIAKRLAEDGAQVVISSRKQSNVDRAVRALRDAHLKVTGQVCHVGKKEDRAKLIESTIAQHGGLDILVSNAAANPYFGSILECPESAWDKIFDVNVKSTFLLVRECAPHLEARGGGSVVLISSVGGYNPSVAMGPYGVSKTALLGLTKALVPQLASMNIRVNCVAPGLVKTKFASAIFRNESTINTAMNNIAMKRTGTPDEIAGMVSFLSSKDASYITGETMIVAGGVDCRL